ncbi:Uncharacterized protein Fot_31624 [Forsythia ovata]|uniref:Uncharacterized protein n=1 Tax=Forsythia ovata TaxID=205694 RepID=A0ABD1T5L2_9LAMI
MVFSFPYVLHNNRFPSSLRLSFLASLQQLYTSSTFQRVSRNIQNGFWLSLACYGFLYYTDFFLQFQREKGRERRESRAQCRSPAPLTLPLNRHTFSHSTTTHRRPLFLPFFTNSSVTNTNIITNVSNVSGNTRISEGSNDDDRCGGKGGDENGNNWNDESNRKKNRDEALMALVEAEKGLETCSRS